MAETKRMTADGVVDYLLEGDGLDFLRESLAWVASSETPTNTLRRRPSGAMHSPDEHGRQYREVNSETGQRQTVPALPPNSSGSSFDRGL